MRVRCAKCDRESDSRDRFCGGCGAPLPELETTPQTAPLPQATPAREQALPLGGPSFLGLNAEPDGSFAYLLEDDLSTSHRGRSLVLIFVLGCVTASIWHWRRDLRDWAVKVSQRPAATHTEQVNYSASPISTSGSEAAGAMPNAQPSTEKPIAESTAQPASQPLPPGNHPARGNAVAEAQRLPQPDPAAAEVQTPAVNTRPIAKPRSENDEPAVATASSDGERPTRESVTFPVDQRRKLASLTTKVTHSKLKVRGISTEREDLRIALALIEI